MVISRRSFAKGALALGSTAALGLPSAARAQDGDNTLRIALMKPAGNLDPHIYRGVWGVQSMIYDPLVRYAAGGEILPGLAESWEVSADGLVYTFRLRPGVTFHDGAPWNADAFIWNYSRWIGHEDHSWLLVSAQYDRMAAVDPMTVELHLKKAIPQTLFELSVVRPVRFLSPDAVDGEQKYATPIGTGPWQVESSDDAQTTLVRNEAYWGDKPAVERVELLVIPDSRSRTSALRAGEIDVIGGDYVSPVTPGEAVTLSEAGLSVTTALGTNTFLLGFNPARPKLQDPRVRRAISISIDRAAIARAIYADFSQPTANLFPDSVPFAGARLPVPSRDVEAAKALLEEAGWQGPETRTKDGEPLAFELVLSEEAVHGSRAVGEVVQAQLREVGIEISIRSLDHATRHGDIPAGLYDLTFFFTIGAPYDPHSTLTNYFLSTFYNGADGKMYVDPALDPLLLAAIEQGGPEQAANYQKVYDWLDERQATAPLLHPQRIWAHGPRVRNFTIPPTEYDMPYEGITLEG